MMKPGWLYRISGGVVALLLLSLAVSSGSRHISAWNDDELRLITEALEVQIHDIRLIDTLVEQGSSGVALISVGDAEPRSYKTGEVIGSSIVLLDVDDNTALFLTGEDEVRLTLQTNAADPAEAAPAD